MLNESGMFKTALRKSLLDDCKGEKLLEILIIFSTAVVKKYMVHKSSNNPVALRLATLPVLNQASQAPLIPLSIAYQSSLRSLLRQKEEAHTRCIRFSDLLDQKVEQLSDRMTLCAGKRGPPVPVADTMKVQKEVVQNWLGNTRWHQTILYGSETYSGDQLLERPFKEVWNVIIGGGTLQPNDDSVDLLGNLEKRVNQHKARLQTWKNFHRQIAQRSQKVRYNQSTINQNEDVKFRFDFSQHKDLHLDLDKNTHQMNKAPVSAILEGIINDMQRDLTSTSDSTRKHNRDRPMITSNQDFGEPIHKPTTEHRFTSGSRNGIRPTNSGNNQSIRDISHVPMSVTAVPLSRIFSPAKQFNGNHNGNAGRVPSISIQVIPESTKHLNGTTTKTVSHTDLETSPSPKVIPNHVVEEAEAMQDEADEIIASVMDIRRTPTPESRASLAERTRMSIAQANPNYQPDSHINPSKPSEEISTATTVIAAGPSVADRRASLLERTQQSMSNVAPNPRPISMMKKQRQSIAYPVNQFETPGRPRLEPMRNATPTEKLFSDEADYASVFKSRPRIKLSPAPTPNADDLPDTPMILEEEDESVDMDGDSWIRSSPLRGRG
jgi:HAUS augmin-like complex subunit 6 N-terminus